MNIKKEVNYLVDSCGTTDPANLIKETGACIVDTIDLPDSTLGMTVSSYGQTTIYKILAFQIIALPISKMII